MLRILRALFIVSVLLAPLAHAADGAAGSESDEPPLSLGITGSTPGEKRKNPTSILKSADVQRLVLQIAETPMSRSDIEAAIADEFFTLDDMVATGLLREQEGLFHIDFNLLSVADQQSILGVSEKLGHDLAAAFLTRRSEFETLAQTHKQPHLGNTELFYIVLGCFSLDWDGLDLTRELGHRAGAQRNIDGHRFTPWAKETGADVSLKGLYWGSHNMQTTEVNFTTFGDHDALPRFGIPDMLWSQGKTFSRFEYFAEGQQAARQLVSAYFPNILVDIGTVMFSLRDQDLSISQLQTRTEIGEKKLGRLLDLLKAADYVAQYGDNYGSVALVLGPEDADMVNAMIAVGRDIMSAWHEENFDNIQSALSDLTPIRNGVPFERVYTEIWHFIFGIANRVLVEEGFFAEPYAKDRRHQGFRPLVWAKRIDETP